MGSARVAAQVGAVDANLKESIIGRLGRHVDTQIRVLVGRVRTTDRLIEPFAMHGIDKVRASS